MLPELVVAAAQGIQGSQLTILNGAQGLGEFTTSIAGEGLAIYEALRRGLASASKPAAPVGDAAVPAIAKTASTRTGA